MTQILVVDDTAIFREPIAAALRHRGYRATGACDGAEALSQVRRSKPDLILLDMAMPVLDGMDVLRELQADPDTRHIPVIVLSAIDEERATRKAKKLGACDYLLKSSFSLQELFHTVQAHLPGAPPAPAPDVSSAPASAPPAAAAAPETGTPALRPLLSPAQAREKLTVCQPLSGYSPGTARLLQLTGDENAAADRVIETISRDPDLAYRLRRLMNSAVFPGGNPADPLGEGVKRIGIRRIHQMVLNLGVLEHFAGRHYAPYIDNGFFWEHALATGLIAAELFSSTESTSARTDLAFTMGLMHDVGRLVLLEQMPQEMQEVFRQSRNGQLPLEPLERKLLNCTHASVMDELLHRWNFPAQIIDPIVLHHLPALFVRQCPVDHPQDVIYLSVADAVARALVLGHSGDDCLLPIDLPETDAPPPGTFDRIFRQVPDQVRQLKLALLGHALPDAATTSLEQLAGNLPTPVSLLPVLSPSPARQALELFCRRWNQTQPPQPARAAMAHLADPSEINTLGKRLEVAEKEQKLGKLPLMILHEPGTGEPSARFLADRPHQYLPMPVSVRHLLKTLADLVG